MSPATSPRYPDVTASELNIAPQQCVSHPGRFWFAGQAARIVELITMVASLVPHAVGLLLSDQAQGRKLTDGS